MTEAAPQPTAIGPFVVLRKLGEGAMGVVYAGYDLALDRKVALKLVRPSLLGNEAARERMIREAQAMARLSHPHVVQVYQVGAHERSLYMAMEHIEGETLGSWLRAHTRPWPLVLRTICDAGRGLAAAHAAGLVHRDFKPDNVLVDAGGRARVVDFGLVQASEGADESADEVTEEPPQTTLPSGQVSGERSGGVRWSARLTQRGNALGTPLYMSPEQHFGQTVGPYSDQYSFALTLYEALYGEHPFCSDSWEGIRQQIRAGMLPQPPPGSAVPWRLFKVISRGLAFRPEDRWPSLTAMIAALEHDPWRRPLGIAAVVGLLGLASAASYAVASRQAQEPPRCGAVTHQLAGVWDGGRAEAVASAFTATRAEFAQDALDRVKSRLDDYAQSWIDESRAVCEAHVSGSQTGRMIDLRSACLGRRKAHLAALVDVFAAADRDVVEHAVQAVAALPSISACDDPEGLVRGAAPPDDPRTAAQVEALRERLARADVLESTGQFEPGLALVRGVRAEADAVAHAPLSAEAALIEGKLQLGAANPGEAEAALVRAIRLGISHDMHAVAAEAAAVRVFVLGEGLSRHAEAFAAEVFAEALIERAHDDGRLAALLSNNLGAVHDLQGNTDRARAYFERTIAGLERRPGPPDPLIAITHHNLGNMYFDRNDFAQAREHYALARQLFTAIVGDAHPFVAHALAGLGDADAGRGEDERALANYEQALRRMEAAYGMRHLYLLQPLAGLGRVHARRGQVAAAEQAFARAVTMADALGLSHPMLAPVLEGQADLAVARGARDRARALYERAAEVYRASGDVEAERRAVLRARDLAPAAK
ncbi:serine/threonine-protein kinase [Nannocystis pusilla]|uniref:Serine/threonine-protein kinase n=1 Tax=Nannocystis pusilla TaxID=889268 RepID=A0ABS7TX20_9BACT|nr:serine/threonine-protein kinase [Nannocystis pusilla]MBZ5712797.1 serine/threonine-protein kinase [Nannocystis pusilla]